MFWAMGNDALIDLLAAELGVSDEARKKWRQRGAVPHKWRLAILELATKRGVRISKSDLAALRPARSREEARV
jgi:nicotinic acid mononucleotide adenylyltransferase